MLKEYKDLHSCSCVEASCAVLSSESTVSLSMPHSILCGLSTLTLQNPDSHAEVSSTTPGLSPRSDLSSRKHTVRVILQMLKSSTPSVFTYSNPSARLYKHKTMFYFVGVCLKTVKTVLAVLTGRNNVLYHLWSLYDTVPQYFPVTLNNNVDYLMISMGQMLRR